MPNHTHASASLHGGALINNPIRYKGTASTEEERGASGLEGLLPAGVDAIGTQLERVPGRFATKPSGLDQYVHRQGLCGRSEALFHPKVMPDPACFVSVVHEPTTTKAHLICSGSAWALGDQRDISVTARIEAPR